MRGRAGEDARRRDHLRLHAPLQIDAAEAAAARLDEQAHRVAQAVGVAADLRADAAHRERAVGRVGRGRRVPVDAETRAAQAGDQRLAKPLLGGLGDERRQVGDRRVLQQGVEALDGAELGGEGAADRVLVQVEDDDRRELAHQPRLGLRLRRAQQQVVAVDVGAVGGAARERGGAVGVGARQEDDVDAVEHARQAAGGELLGDDDERLGAGRLVAVLWPR